MLEHERIAQQLGARKFTIRSDFTFDKLFRSRPAHLGGRDLLGTLNEVDQVLSVQADRVDSIEVVRGNRFDFFALGVDRIGLRNIRGLVEPVDDRFIASNQ